MAVGTLTNRVGLCYIAHMSVEEIEKAIINLTAKERAKIRAFLEELDADIWDKQIEEDAKNGKLDKLFEDAMDDMRKGRVKKL